MEYVKPFTYFVGATGGFVNLLLCGICNLIPVVGNIVLLGYRAEVSEELLRDKRTRRHPEFDFGRFGDYLSRGVWPYVYNLIIGLTAVGVVIGGLALVGVALAGAGPPKDPTLVVVAFAIGYLVIITTMLLLVAFVLWPMELHAQITRRFAPVEAFGFAVRFQRKVWGQTLVSLIVFVVLSSVLNLLGLLACYVGLFLTMVLQFMAQQHLMTQLYRLYLDEGGDPLQGPDDFDDEYDD